jgi:hypothetical protein
MQGHRKGREIVDRFVAPDGAERGPNWQPRDTVLLPRTAVQTGLVKKRPVGRLRERKRPQRVGRQPA